MAEPQPLAPRSMLASPSTVFCVNTCLLSVTPQRAARGAGTVLMHRGCSSVTHLLPLSRKPCLGFRVRLATSHSPLGSRPGTQVWSGLANAGKWGVFPVVFSALLRAFLRNRHKLEITDRQGRHMWNGWWAPRGIGQADFPTVLVSCRSLCIIRPEAILSFLSPPDISTHWLASLAPPARAWPPENQGRSPHCFIPAPETMAGSQPVFTRSSRSA